LGARTILKLRNVIKLQKNPTFKRKKDKEKNQSSSFEEDERSESWEDSDEEKKEKKQKNVNRVQVKTPMSSKIKYKPSAATPSKPIRSPRSPKSLNVKVVKSEPEGEDKGSIYRSVSGIVRSIILTKNKEKDLPEDPDKGEAGQGEKEKEKEKDRESLQPEDAENDPFFKSVTERIQSVIKKTRKDSAGQYKKHRDSADIAITIKAKPFQESISDEKEENVFDVWRKEGEKEAENEKEENVF